MYTIICGRYDIYTEIVPSVTVVSQKSEMRMIYIFYSCSAVNIMLLLEF